MNHSTKGRGRTNVKKDQSMEEGQDHTVNNDGSGHKFGRMGKIRSRVTVWKDGQEHSME